MVSSVGSNPYSYLGQLQGTPASSKSASTANASGASATATSSTGTTAQSLVSSLLTGSNGFTPAVLSLLQENSAGSFDPVTSLLGGTSTNNALTGLYSSLYSSAAAASVAQAKSQSAAVAPKGANAIDSLLNGQTQSSIARNQAIQLSAASAASANSYGADGVTKLLS